MNRTLSKVWIIVIVFALFGGGYFAWQYFGVSEPKEITKRDSIRKLELQQIAVYQGIYYSMNDQYYQSMDYPLDILPWTDPKTGDAYGWIDNTKNEQKFCTYADLEKGGFYIVSHYGTGEIRIEPRTLNDCEKVPNAYPKTKETKVGIDITSPVGGEQWKEGESYSILWKQWGLGGKKVKICLFGLKPFSTRYYINAKTEYRGACAETGQYEIAQVFAEKGRYSWKIPLDLLDRFEETPDTYAIKIIPLSKEGITSVRYGFSDPFKIY